MTTLELLGGPCDGETRDVRLEKGLHSIHVPFRDSREGAPHHARYVPQRDAEGRIVALVFDGEER